MSDALLDDLSNAGFPEKELVLRALALSDLALDEVGASTRQG